MPQVRAEKIARAFGDANALHQRGDLGEARRRYRAILRQHPALFEVLYALGVLEAQCGQFDEAFRLLRRAVDIRPDEDEARLTLAKVLTSLGRPELAMPEFDALLARIDNVEALLLRGNLHLGMCHWAQAAADYERLLGVAPGQPQALERRGIALHHLGRHDEALASYDAAIAGAPNFADAHHHRGNALRDLGRWREALADFNRVLQIEPDYEFVAGSALGLRLQCCDWSDYDTRVERIAADVNAGKRVIAPFTFLAFSDSPAAQRACAGIWAQERFPAATRPLCNRRYRHDRIRIAYVSADFGEHATSYLAAGLFERHDRNRFEVTAISLGKATPCPMRTRVEAAFEHFVEARDKSDFEIARLLREREIDIAVDLKGYTQDGRTGIFAHRPAPVQVNYLGYPGTLGADYFDYIIADGWVIPTEDQCHYAEKSVYLPDSYQVNDSRRFFPQRMPTRAEAGLPVHGVVYCSFNNTYKITPAMFDIWMRLLLRAPESVLWLLGDNETAVDNLRREASNRGIDSTRLIFAPRADQEEHLARHRLADICLDTLPYNAHTTASDALWCGTPVVTCAGTTFAGRVAASLLNAVEMPELVTHTLADYEALALRLATDGSMLNDLRTRLADRRTSAPLFDTDRFRRHLEAAYQLMWDRSQRGEAPASFAIETIQ